MQNKSILAYTLILLPLAISIYFLINPKALIPNGYELAIDGYVISRTLIFIFTFYLLSKLGYFITNKKD
ncbi:hypothetical protein [Aneurinibacillus thermoaerophilus]|uniref:Uncharacterized protein n=1 Tax=Aneurinibacillus thermoaerophilus TaxID=143495 RepID=A0A1G8BFI6_ANETH|nr:hypothetical protein [Aneurinibacillus thermoaerophilus]AMA71431.1 ribonuclease BN [Aneurinibacillus sp. XH2]MED0674252.1 hypothetical protein [Aneurinibacillus thermoaerophilus]MED0678653.1 hypothetical protein [Aneurinibacillus thermoaerophilus]MED0737802.1 hypothetical protein [Aneurinibacillus thermoaerophilus]MED0755834.1 hypothetical protein [Aneurinibacillus thermoaerophilus]